MAPASPAASPFSALSPAVHRASTIVFPDLRSFLARRAQFYDGYAYGQSGTPTTYELAHRVAELEGGGKAVLVPTGTAAIALVNATLLTAGDHVLLPAGAYAGSHDALRQLFGRWGVTHSLYPHDAGSGIAAFIQPNTRLLWLESPTSQRYEMQDVPALAAAARARGLRVAMDNSWATPLGFRPLAHGVDCSVMSLTKYAGGHSDLLMGSIATRDEDLYRRLRDTAEHLGYCVSSDDCFLVLRGLATLGLRLERQAASGLAVAGWLAQHQAVGRVFHPPLPADPGHALWRAQHTLGNGLLSFTLKQPGLEPVERFVNALKQFRIGPGWGGTHSLVAAYPLQDGAPSASAAAGRWLVRLSIGLEDAGLLLGDLAQALALALPGAQPGAGR
jgi:cystathionine beta-lyase